MKSSSKPKFTDAAIAAVFISIVCAVSQITIVTPSGVPFTFQTLAVALCGYMLSAKWSAASIFTYIMLGMVGLPVFSGSGGGVGLLAGPTGGFILGFLPLAFFCSLSNRAKARRYKILLSIVGLFICHLLGSIYFAVVSGCGFVSAFITSSLPFLLKDVISLPTAEMLSRSIKKRIKK